MKTIQATVVVDAQRRAVIPMPGDVEPGSYEVVVVVNGPAVAAEPTVTGPPLPWEGFPVHDVGPWPEGLSLSREDMYGDDGR